MSVDEVWPLFALRLRTPRLVLRPVRDDDLPELLAVVEGGVHDPATMPFSYPWTRASGDELRRNVVVWQWYLRSQVKPNNWTIAFAVELDGHIVGVQDLKVSEFSALRTVSTGSWLGQPFHGRGIGTEMRAAVLLFAFDALGARFAESGAASWNDASLGVSRRLGYRPNGVSHHVDSQGQTFVEQRLRLDESEFVRPTWQLEVEGFERARADLLG